jgi:hypothetical protein
VERQVITTQLPTIASSLHIDSVSNADVNNYNVQALKMPILIVHTEHDQLASHEAGRRGAARGGWRLERRRRQEARVQPMLEAVWRLELHSAFFRHGYQTGKIWRAAGLWRIEGVVDSLTERFEESDMLASR